VAWVRRNRAILAKPPAPPPAPPPAALTAQEACRLCRSAPPLPINRPESFVILGGSVFTHRRLCAMCMQFEQEIGAARSRKQRPPLYQQIKRPES
jgi:hypothetical protein